MSRPGTDPLLPGLAAGREEAYAALYDRLGERLYRAALGMLGRPEDAEDAVQDTFTALVRSRRRLVDVQDLTAYVFAALHHAAARCAVRRARAGREAMWGSRPRLTEAPGRGPCVTTGPRGDRLQRALSALPPAQREVIALKIDGELTFAQIARVTGVSINTAASRYRYALEKLRAALEE